jgi:hypothetical protein
MIGVRLPGPILRLRSLHGVLSAAALFGALVVMAGMVVAEAALARQGAVLVVAALLGLGVSGTRGVPFVVGVPLLLGAVAAAATVITALWQEVRAGMPWLETGVLVTAVLLTVAVLRCPGEARRRSSMLVMATGAVLLAAAVAVSDPATMAVAAAGAAVALAVLSVRRPGVGWLAAGGGVVLAAAVLLLAPEPPGAGPFDDVRYETRRGVETSRVYSFGATAYRIDADEVFALAALLIVGVALVVAGCVRAARVQPPQVGDG